MYSVRHSEDGCLKKASHPLAGFYSVLLNILCRLLHWGGFYELLGQTAVARWTHKSLNNSHINGPLHKSDVFSAADWMTSIINSLSG